MGLVAWRRRAGLVEVLTGDSASRHCSLSGRGETSRQLLFAVLRADMIARNAAAHPGFSTCRLRARASEPHWTSLVKTDPEPTNAPAPILTGATSGQFEPMKAFAPTSVRPRFHDPRRRRCVPPRNSACRPFTRTRAESPAIHDRVRRAFGFRCSPG
jgi:hypothetical protein